MRRMAICMALVLAFLVGRAGAKDWYMGTATAADTVASLTAFLAASSSGDSLYWRADHTSPVTNEAVIFNSVGPRHFFGQGYTETISGTASYWMRLHTGTSGSTITNLNIVHATGGRTDALIYMTANTTAYTFTGLSFTISSGRGLYNYATGSTVNITGGTWTLSGSTTGAYCTDGVTNVVSGLIATGGATALQITGSSMITDGAFSGQTANAIAASGTITISGCSFSSMQLYGVSVGAGASTVYGNTFSDCATASVYYTTSNTTGYDNIYENTFSRCGTYGISIAAATDSMNIHSNTFAEIKYKANHGVMVGQDGGGSTGSTLAVRIYGNAWDISAANDTLTLENVHCVVVKAKGVIGYNNTVQLARAFTPQGALRNFTFVYQKGGQSGTWYNNSIDVPYMTAFKLGVQGTTGTKLCKYWNNRVGDSCYQFAYAVDDSLVATGHGVEFGNNLSSGLNLYLEDSSTSVEMTTLDATVYMANNFTDSASWRMDYGGRGGLTGMTDSAEGFQRVGISTTSPGQPAISKTQPGFRHPVEALESIRSIGALKDVTLDMYAPDPQAGANLKVWQFSPHTNGAGTFQQVAGDTLQVRRAFQ
jgi:hypothetical protein